MRRQFLLTASVALVLATGAFFVSAVPLRPALWPVSLAAILLFSAPVFVGCVRWLGRRTGLLVMAALGVYALVFEALAVQTGLPYGRFGYGGLLGPPLLGDVPAAVLVAWSPLVLGVLAVLPPMGRRRRIVAGTIMLVAVDMVLDPAAVELGFWQWQEPGVDDGVPLINFLGWVISGGLAIAATVGLERRLRAPRPARLLALNLAAILVFWSLVNLFSAQWLPAILGGLLLAGLYRVRPDATLGP